LKLYYYLFILLVYIDRKFPLFIPSKDESLIKKMPTSLHEKTGWRQWAIHFLCTRPHCADPRPPEPDPLCMNVINGWPFTCAEPKGVW